MVIVDKRSLILYNSYGGVIMSNELIKYDPELNTIPLRKFTPIEMNLFFSIISRMRDKGDQTVRFSFEGSVAKFPITPDLL